MTPVAGSGRLARSTGELDPPSAYVAGYAKARAVDQEAADNYIRHTTIGDPELDPVMEELSSMNPGKLHGFIRSGIEQDEGGLRAAPQRLRDFFRHVDEEPPWLDRASFHPGRLAFYRNVADTVTAFLCGVLVEGFTTLIRKSFVATGRVQYEPTQRRQKQNIRQLVDIFLPGGLERDGDGWRLSARIRFIHARVRNLLERHDDWDAEAWGVPLSSAHMGFAISVFSAGLLEYSARMGAVYSDEEQKSVLAVWRYTGHVMGIPHSILFADAEEALAIRRIAHMCEPPLDADSATMVKAWLSSAAPTAGITEPNEARAVTKLVYSVSRALVGNAVADQLEIPKTGAVGTLFLYRLNQTIKKVVKNSKATRLENFSTLLSASAYDFGGMSYDMPDRVKHGESRPW